MTEIVFNEQQNQALDLALRGHSFILLGSAGTGKSITVSAIVRKLRREGKVVALTCSTGIACQVFGADLQATTLHQFAGLLDGRYDPKDIGSVISNSVKHKGVLKRILTTDTLVVDECSMISMRTFQSLIEVLSLKNKNKIAGGIQLIFSGDFKQLRPVKNNRYHDAGKYCFEEDCFRKVLSQRVVLREIMRQCDPLFIHSIENVSSGGRLRKDTVDLIKTLNRELPESSNQLIKLFARNDLVDDFNRSKILEMPGLLHELPSTDTGDMKALGFLTVPKILCLKIGMPVILLRNLSDRLVNGLRGVVTDIDKDGPTINFESINFKKTTRVEKFKFEGKIRNFVRKFNLHTHSKTSVIPATDPRSIYRENIKGEILKVKAS